MLLQDLLFPKFCFGCKLPGVYICSHCYEKLHRVNDAKCFYCGKASYSGLTHPSCQNYLYIDGATSIFRYNGILVKIVKNAKYRLWTEVLRDFFLAIHPEDLQALGFFRKLKGDVFLQPIPLTGEKLRKRGFNQAEFFALYLQKYLDYQIIRCLKRDDDKRPQAEVSTRIERYKNVRGVFKFNQSIPSTKVENTTVILVDDVITSGSTVKEAARILKRAGYGKVFAISLARG